MRRGGDGLHRVARRIEPPREVLDIDGVEVLELSEEATQAAENIPAEATEIVAGDVAAAVGELDGLPARATAALALGTAFGTPRREQLASLKAAQEFGSEEGHAIFLVPCGAVVPVRP